MLFGRSAWRSGGRQGPEGGATRTFRAVNRTQSQPGVLERWPQRATGVETRSIRGEGRGGEMEPQASAVTWRQEGRLTSVVIVRADGGLEESVDGGGEGERTNR